MSSVPLRVHVLYESSAGGSPHGCSEIRLLRPLAHPTIQHDIALTYGLKLPDELVDIIIVERLWNQACDHGIQMASFRHARENGVRVAFEIDDDLLGVNNEACFRAGITISQQMWVRRMVRMSDGVIVSTPNLATRLGRLSSNIDVIPNALDENLFRPSEKFNPRMAEDGSIVFGYMGTFTHLDDLLSILNPIRTVLAKYKDRVRFEIVGVGNSVALNSLFFGLPVRLLQVPNEAVPYPDFVRWFQKNIKWDFGIAPLVDSEFTRSKSDIKYLDYGVQSIPGIFSNVPAYQETIRHGLNGLLAKNKNEWEQSLSSIIDDPNLRLKLAKEAHRQVWEERMLRTEAKIWAGVIRRIFVAHPTIHEAR